MDTCADLQTTSVPARRRYLVVGFLGMLFSGIIYAWSILKAPMMEAFGWNASQMAVNYTLTMCFFCLGSLLTGLLLRRIPVKLLLLAAGVLVCTGFVMTARMEGHSVWELYISYGMAIGFGSGLSYNSRAGYDPPASEAGDTPVFALIVQHDRGRGRVYSLSFDEKRKSKKSERTR